MQQFAGDLMARLPGKSTGPSAARLHEAAMKEVRRSDPVEFVIIYHIEMS